MTGLRDVGIAFSLANVLFYPVWAELLPGAYGHYYLKNPPTVNANLGMLLVVLLSAFVLWAGSLLVKHAPHPYLQALGKMAFLVVFLLAFNGVRYHVLRFAPIGKGWVFNNIDVFLIRPIVFLCIFLLFTRWRPWIIRGAMGLVLALVPFVAVTFSQSAWAAIKIRADMPSPDFLDKSPAPLLLTKPGMSRVIWLLFDGLDQHLTFDKRPRGVDLPNLDRFRQQTIYASSAHSPALNTLLSMPALLTGRLVDAARPIRANELLIYFADAGQAEKWSAQPSVFTKARELGYNTALVGYYHPYCRVIGHQVTKCVWTTQRWGPIGLDDPQATVPQVVSRVLAREAAWIHSSLPFVWRFDLLRSPEDPFQPNRPDSIRDHIENYLLILEEAKEVVKDPTFQLVFVHWPIPHHPYIYDRQMDDFSRNVERSYPDNLKLVDRTVGQIREVLETSGLWDTSALLLTSDHPLEGFHTGPTVPTVPFLLKLPGQKKAVPYEQRLNTVVIPDLLLGILSGRLSDPQHVVSWLESKQSWK